IGRGRRCHNHGGMCTAPKSTATGADCNTYRYWLLLLSLGRTWCEIPRATRLCLFLARGESFGSTWRRLLVTWRQSGLTRCGAGFAFSCVLRGGWESKECSSNDDRYDALHCQLLLVVCASEGQECRTKTARMLVHPFHVEFSFVAKGEPGSLHYPLRACFRPRGKDGVTAGAFVGRRPAPAAAGETIAACCKLWARALIVCAI